MINSGDKVKGKLSARFFNRGETVFDWYDRTKARGEGGVTPVPTPASHVSVMVRNDSGVVARRGEILEFSDFLLGEYNPRYLWFSGTTPDLTNVGWGLLLDPAETGVIRECLIAGVGLAYIQFPDDIHTQKRADRKLGQRVLWAAEEGPVKILHVGPASGAAEWEYLCVVQIMDEAGGESLIRFQLDATLALKGHAKAQLLDDDWNVLDPPVEIEVYDPFQSGAGMWAGSAGYQGWGVARPGTFTDEDGTRAKFDIVWMEQTAAVIQFTTTQFMGETSVGQCNATISWFDHQGRELVGTITLHDELGQFPDVHSGAKGTAVYDYKNNYYRIVSCQRVVIHAEAIISGSICPDAEVPATTITITNFAGKPVGDYVGDPPSTPVIANIGPITAGMNGDKVLLRRIDNTMGAPTWEIVRIAKHKVDLVVNEKWESPTLKQTKRKFWLEACDETETDSDVVTFGDCDN